MSLAMSLAMANARDKSAHDPIRLQPLICLEINFKAQHLNAWVPPYQCMEKALSSHTSLVLNSTEALFLQTISVFEGLHGNIIFCGSLFVMEVIHG